MFQIAVLGGKPEQISADIKSLASGIGYYDYDADKLMDPIEPNPDIILCFAGGEIPALEIAQCLRMNYPGSPVFFIATEKKDFDKKKLIKNGFSDAYLFPWEKADFLRSLKNEAVYSVLPELRDYKPIKVVDLQPGAVLDFGMRVYLPRNNKLLPFSAQGEPVSIEKFAKLTENNLNTLFVHKDDVEKFYKHTAETFKKLMKPNAMSETEKQEKLEKAVRELLSDMFIEDMRENTFTKSQALLKEVKEIIHLLIKDENSDLLSKVTQITNQEENFYLHLSNVSTYAGVFAIILGFEKPEELALAGLLHDIGKINLPVEIADMDMKDMGSEALAAYKNHPKYSLDVIRSKKMVVPDKVAKAIAQHHEHMNGTGYPAGLEGPRISPEGRVLAIANTFDHLTSLKSDQKNLSPAEALKQMIDDNSRDPGRMILDIEYLKKLKDVFIKE